MNDLDKQVIEKDLEINQVEVTLEISKVIAHDAQRKMDGAFKVLDHHQSAFNNLRSNFNGTQKQIKDQN